MFQMKRPKKMTDKKVYSFMCQYAAHIIAEAEKEFSNNPDVTREEMLHELRKLVDKMHAYHQFYELSDELNHIIK